MPNSFVPDQWNSVRIQAQPYHSYYLIGTWHTRAHTHTHRAFTLSTAWSSFFDKSHDNAPLFRNHPQNMCHWKINESFAQVLETFLHSVEPFSKPYQEFQFDRMLTIFASLVLCVTRCDISCAKISAEILRITENCQSQLGYLKLDGFVYTSSMINGPPCIRNLIIHNWFSPCIFLLWSFYSELFLPLVDPIVAKLTHFEFVEPPWIDQWISDTWLLIRGIVWIFELYGIQTTRINSSR